MWNCAGPTDCGMPIGTPNVPSDWPVARSVGVTRTDVNGALPAASVSVMRPGSLTVTVAHVAVVTHETPPAVAMSVVCPAPLPVAVPNESMPATDASELCHCTVGVDPEPPLPLPPVPELTEKSNGGGVLKTSTVVTPDG